MKEKNLKEWFVFSKSCRIMFLLLIFTIPLWAQNIKITGVITDKAGDPLPGTTVIIKGTTTGVVSDIDGRFSINVPNRDVVLLFSFMGFATQEISIGDRTNIEVTLIEAGIEIEELVVVGYGVQKKESVVGSIVQTTGKDLRQSGNVTDLKQALTGRLPGVTTIVASGEPGGYEDGGSATAIYIRGQNSWNNSQPLILVDGVERKMENVDVNEVESISVLKDASATAVFGVKGANGVILITTKRGKSGRPQISFNYDATCMSISKVPEKLDSYDALRIRNESIEREVSLNNAVWADYTPTDILNRYRYRDYPEYEWLYPSIDWTHELFKDTGWSHRAGMNITGGTDFVKYFGSFAYTNEQDMFRDYDNHKGYKSGYDYNRFNFRSNFDMSLTKTTLLKINLAGYYGVKSSNNAFKNVQSGNNEMLWFAIYRMSPDLYPAQYPDGTWGQNVSAPVENVQNPAQTAWDLGVRETKNTQLNTDFQLEQKLNFITKGLSATASFFFDNNIRSIGGIYDHANAARPDGMNGYGRYVYPERWQPGMTIDEYSQLLPYSATGYAWTPTPWNRLTEETDYDKISRRTMYQMRIDYARQFNLHNVSALGLFKREEYATGAMFPEYREDWVFRATYDYDTRYFFEGNGAYNGSAKFGPSYRFDFFPSMAVGWVASNEKFFQLKWMNFLKFRYSLGWVGDDSGGTRWMYAAQYRVGEPSGSQSALLQEDATVHSPYTFSRETVIPNPNAHWETARKANYGLEMGLLKNLFFLTYDYYTEHRYEMMVGLPVPPYLGGNAPQSNLGKVNSNGHELTLKVNKRTAYGLEYWSMISFTHTENKVITRADRPLTPEYKKNAGYAIGQPRTQITNGFYNNWDEVFASTPQGVNDQNKIPGFYNILDFNADGIIDDLDAAPYGYSNIPQNTYNLTLGASYKGFSASLQFYGVSNVSRTVALENFPINYALNTVFDHALDYWSKDNPNASSYLPRWKTPNSEFIGNYNMYDASYIRLKTAEIAYSFRPKVLERIHMSELRLFVNGNNLWLWSRMPDDREAGSPADRAYPVMKRYNFGVNLTF